MRTFLRLALCVLLAVGALGAKAQSLSVSPSSVLAGQSVSATWSGIAAPSATDWIGLYVAGSGNSAFVAFRYTDGTAAGSVPFVIPNNAAAGNYELRLFSNNGYTLLATSGGLTVSTPPPVTLAASPASLTSGQSVNAAWTNIVSPSATDWIGLYAPGAADTAFLAWIYTSGAAAGSASLPIPLDTATGTYELRIFSNDGYTRLATSNSLAITAPPPASLAASPASVIAGQSVSAAWTNIFSPSATDWIGLFAPGAASTEFVAWRYTDGTAAGSVPFPIPVNTAGGTYELRLFSNDGYTLLATSASLAIAAAPPVTLSASPASVPVGGSTVTAAWTSIESPTATDWIGLYAPGTPDTGFLSWRYTDGSAAGSVPFDIAASVAQGAYELRLFSANGYTRLATSANLTVGQSQLYFIEVDHLNTARLIANSGGTPVWRNDNTEPFADSLPDENPSGLGVFEFPLTLSQYYRDKETGLQYSYYRDCYDAANGRFCQSDPIGLAGGINTYPYAGANSLSNIDPLGLQIVIPGGGAAGGLGGIGGFGGNGGGGGSSSIPGANQLNQAIRNMTGRGQASSCPTDGQDNDPCEDAKADARRIYNDLVTKRIPQYLSGGTRGSDPNHLKTIGQRQTALKDAIRRVKLYCKQLPPELPEWEAVANQTLPILY